MHESTQSLRTCKERGTSSTGTRITRGKSGTEARKAREHVGHEAGEGKEHEGHKTRSTAQKKKFSIKDFLSKWDQITFTEEILNGKLQFLKQCRARELIRHKACEA